MEQASEHTVVPSSIIVLYYIVCVWKISVYYVFLLLLRRIMENTANTIANEMHDLSACAKFPDACFQ